MDNCDDLISKDIYLDEESNYYDFLWQHIGLVLTEPINNKRIGSVKGSVRVNDLWFHININYNNFPLLKDAEIKIQHQLQMKIFNRFSKNSAIIDDNWTINDLIAKLPELFGISDGIENFLFNRNSQEIIDAEIIALYSTHKYVISINDDRTRFYLTISSQGKDHFLDLQLPSLQILNISLPKCVNWQELFGKCTTLTSTVQQFTKYLDDLMLFYENFIDIDELCHVIRPTPATTKDNWRLFMLKDRVFLKLSFNDPFAPLASMTLNIIGPTYEVTNLRDTYSAGLSDWDIELDVHKNLLRIFDLCFFPMKPDTTIEETLLPCNICYTIELDDGEIPIVSCDNSRCTVIYHAACLEEWFNTLVDGKTFLDVSFGKCPFCKTKLSTSFRDMLN